MNNNWIEDDLIRHENKLNFVQNNRDSNSLICWLYMENQKYYITDMKCKLQATLNPKVKFKKHRPQNNRRHCLRISIKQYFYSSQLMYVFIYIDDLTILNTKLTNFNELKLTPNDLVNGGTLIKNKFGKTPLKTHVNQPNSPNIMVINPKPAPERNEAFFKKALNQAFTKDSQEEIEPKPLDTQDMTGLILESFTAPDLNASNIQMYSSQLNKFNQPSNSEFGQLSFINSTSLIKVTPPTESSTQIAPVSFSGSHIATLVNKDATVTSPTSNKEATISKNQVNSPIYSNPSASNSNQKITADLSSENMTNDDMCSSFSSSGSSSNESEKRKKKLMQINSKACDQFVEDRLTDDEEDPGSGKTTNYILSKRIIGRTYSSSSDSSSVRSLRITNVLDESPSKSSLFASKQNYIREKQKLFNSEKKSQNFPTLFSPLSKQKQPNVRNLLNQLNQSLDESIISKKAATSINLAINKQEQIQRRKRLYDPNSPRVEEAFDNDEQINPSSKIRLMTTAQPIKSLQTTISLTDEPTDTSKQNKALGANLNDHSRQSVRSIPGAQVQTNDKTSSTDRDPVSISELSENVWENVTSAKSTIISLNVNSL